MQPIRDRSRKRGGGGGVGGEGHIENIKIKDEREAEEKFFSSRSGWHFFKQEAKNGTEGCSWWEKMFFFCLFFFQFDCLWQELSPSQHIVAQ